MKNISNLPSDGINYHGLPNNKKQKSIKYRTLKAIDDSNIKDFDKLKEGTYFFNIVSSVIIESPAPPFKLLTGDMKRLLIDLRIDSIGNEYEIEIYDNIEGKKFKHIIDLTKIKNKELSNEIKEDGTYEIIINNIKYKIRLLSDNEKNKFNESTKNIDIIKNSVISIDDNDQIDIKSFISELSLKEYRELIKKVSGLEPDIDSKFNIKSPYGNEIEYNFTIPFDFFL